MRTLNRAAVVYLAWVFLFGCVWSAESAGLARGSGPKAAEAFYFPGTGIRTPGQAALLAIDNVSLPLRNEVRYHLSKPRVRKEPVLRPSRDNPNAPDYLGTEFYGTVLRDRGKFRMWYTGCGLPRSGEGASPLLEGPHCYAESDDGITWTKPKLGKALFRGSRDHNALSFPETAEGAVPRWNIIGVNMIKDEDDPDPARRYKLVYEVIHRGRTNLRTATGPDGIAWAVAPGILPGRMEHTCLYKYNGTYFINGQVAQDWFRPRVSGRQGFVRVSPDFKQWLEEAAESFLLPEPRDPRDRGSSAPYDQVHLGVAATSLGNVLVGLTCVWHNHPDFAKISGDLALVVSNDGMAFREPVKGHLFLAAEESPAPPVPGKDYRTVLCVGNSILNVGDETRIYHGRWRNIGWHKGMKIEDYYHEVALVGHLPCSQP